MPLHAETGYWRIPAPSLAEVVIAQNDLESLVAVDVLDGSRSRVRVDGNRWDAGYVGVQVILNVDGEPSVDNTVLVSRNRGTVGPYLGWGAGVYFEDPWIPWELGYEWKATWDDARRCWVMTKLRQVPAG